MKLSTWKSYLPYILSVAVVLVLIVYLYLNVDQYQQLLDLSVDSLLLLLILVLTAILTNGFINYFLYQGLGVSLTLNESIGLSAVNTLANQFPFAGGLVAKGVYLKRRHELAYTLFLSATLALYVCFVAANGVVGIALIGYWVFVNGTALPILLVLGFGGMAASVFLLWLPINVGPVPGKWGQRLIQLMNGWQFLSQKRLLVEKLIGLQFLTTLIFAGRLWIVFLVLSQDVTLAQCLLFAAATILTRLVSITPDGIGIREAIVAGVAAVLGFDIGISVLAAGIDRLITTLVVIVVGTTYTYILSKQVVNVQYKPTSCPSAIHKHSNLD